MESVKAGASEEPEMNADNPEDTDEGDIKESPLQILSSNVAILVPEVLDTAQNKEKDFVPMVSNKLHMPTEESEVPQQGGDISKSSANTIQPKQGDRPKTPEETIQPEEDNILRPEEETIQPKQGDRPKTPEETIQPEEDNILRPEEETIQPKQGDSPKSSAETIQPKQSDISKSLEESIQPKQGDIPKSPEETVQLKGGDIPKAEEAAVQSLEVDMVKVILRKEDFEAALKEAGERLVAVDFMATWCGPCRTIRPLFHSLSLKHDDVVFLEVDADDCEEVVRDCEVMCVPTFQFYKKEKKVGEFCGAIKEKLEAIIAELK
ncbi:PREDICTED: thioredoxin domain-containing protein 2 [Galeopterus variegatus]|uniref:Thioredoxin domain-containing protein 2 n=1 Tax=Galeopterus variegatus TaxID=482537 RepID=A0ABM0RKC8_GALVR|nr:PREDICTED: thioredoxin domain-containing protein 2 [Galeopterus variegatus]